MFQQKTEYLLVTAGHGPEECALAVAKLMPLLHKSAQRHGLELLFQNHQPGKFANNYRSVVIQIKGQGVASFKREWLGTIKWDCQSPYRPKHKRKTWYISVNEYDNPVIESTIEKKDLLIETMRASGPGGQHVNKTNSAVRITHLPSKISAIGQEFRSFHQNKKSAIKNLEDKLKRVMHKQEVELTQTSWQTHEALKRGDPIKVFKGIDFTMK